MTSYRYDAENRLVQVLTSRDSIIWEQEAAYDYYKHGPLARAVLGQGQAQELRYSYTLQGWLKGVNSGGLFTYVPPGGGTSEESYCSPGTYPYDMVLTRRPSSGGPATYTARHSITFQNGFTAAPGDSFTTVIDPGAAACVVRPPDGGIIPTDPLSYPIAQDSYNFSLHYYPGDYTPIAATGPVPGVLEAIPSQAAPLYNGNIAAMAVNLPFTSDGTKVYNYHYDQLNRLVAMDAFNGLNTTNHTFTPVQLNDYQERVSYDPNGNILGYLRNGYQGGGYAMDNLTYNYNHPTTNQLSSITDKAGGTYTEDIKDQGTGDYYHYDKIGNLTADGSNSISWTVYGKIANQTGLSGTISYLYDAGGNRITKKTGSGTTLYVRDAQGNVLSTYQQSGSGNFAQSEIDLYGSSRLGLARAPAVPSQTILMAGGSVAYVTSFTRGLKSYELTNHLGNVLVTITDKKIAVSSGGNSSLIDQATADVATAQDYYPFGMIMPGRSFTAAGAGSYRYGFNGKENDNEVKGVGDQIDYGMRVYDPRIGKFLSVDPLTGKYPWYTPYQFAGNKPVWAKDLDGLEENTTSTYVYHPPVMFKPAFKGIISITDATDQSAHKVFEGNYGQLLKADPNRYSTDIVNAFVGNNIGTSESRLNFTMTGTRSAVSKSWKGSDMNYFVQYSYSFTNNNATEIGTFELKVGSIQASARLWDPLKFLLVNKVVSTVLGAEVFTSASRVVQTGENAEKYLYRFDTRTLEEIKAAGGLKPWGTDLDLLRHATGNGTESGYVATSTDEGVLEKLFGSQKGYIYKIRWQSNGVNVNEALGAKSPHPDELEVAVPGEIKFSDIISHKSVNQ